MPKDFTPPQLGCVDFVAPRQGGPHQSHRDPVAYPVIGRSADNLKGGIGFIDRNPTNSQTIGIGVSIPTQHLAHHHLFQLGEAGFPYRLHFESQHVQGMGNLLDRFVGQVDVIP